MLSYSCVCCVCLPERLREWNKIASSHITEIGWQAGWPRKSCSHLVSGLLTCILNDFHIKAFAENLLCHSKGFLQNWDRTMKTLSDLARLEKQNPPLYLIPLHLELLFETPCEGRYALKNRQQLKKTNLKHQNRLFPWNATTPSQPGFLLSPNTHQPSSPSVPRTLESSGVAWHSRKRDRFTVRPATHSLTV